jgi:hypothetical protein
MTDDSIDAGWFRGLPPDDQQLKYAVRAVDDLVRTA